MDYPGEIKNKYNFLDGSVDSQYQWEDYVLKHMIYGVDIDYKAVIITSLTLTLSTLQHKPKNTKLPQLIGHNLIHQNALINAAPFYKREEIFSQYKTEIARLRKMKTTSFDKFVKLRDELTEKLIPSAGPVASYADSLKIGCIELALPEVYFNEDGSLNVHGGMDIVIGNPPWEIWKPNSDEFFSEYDPNYRRFSSKTAKKRQEAVLEQQFPKLKAKWENEQDCIKAGSKYFRSINDFKFQTWKVNGRKTSADLNLYKVSLERFTQLAKPGASFSVLVQDNFATDNGSTGLRHLVIDNYDLKEFLSFENSKGIFEAVHRSTRFSVLTFTGKQTNNKIFKAFFYQHDLSSLNNNDIKMNYSMAFLKKMEPERYALVEARSQELLDLFAKIRLAYAPLRDSKLIKFGNDFHRTNDADKFIDRDTVSPSDIPLYEGKYMNQFMIMPSKVQFFVKEEEAIKRVGEDLSHYRLALRDVASPTNIRSLIVTLLPPNTVSANSITVEKEAGSMELRRKLFILGFMNSYVADYVMRSVINNHLSQFFLKQLPMPSENDVSDSSQIIAISKSLLQEDKGHYDLLNQEIKDVKYNKKPHDELIAELNARIMLDFNLTRSEVISLMKTFESPKHRNKVRKETQRLLDCYDKLTEGDQDE